MHLRVEDISYKDRLLPIQTATFNCLLHPGEAESASCEEVEALSPEVLRDMLCEVDIQWYYSPKAEAGTSYFELKDNKGNNVLLEKSLTNVVAMRLLNQVYADIVPVYHKISELRRIKQDQDYSVDGHGVVKLLTSWQHPLIGRDRDRKKFDQIEKFLRVILGRPSISIEIPHSHGAILVRDGDLRLPLESHGTGIHQLIILAIAVLSEDNALFGIEEPEIHLHPVLQRRFLKFLREETGNNRYIITTHSQTMIAPSEDVDVIHLKMEDGVTIPKRVTTNVHALEALDDLGVRASDLLQANAVIWVEGPSDRIYLKHWMELVSRELGGPELSEGIDYAMMFYGGRLLSHLSLEREGEIDEGFIQLLRINQRSPL